MRSPLRRPTFLESVSLVVIVAYTAAVVAFVIRHCYFYGDDFSGFLMARTEKFWRAVFYPVGGQVVPAAHVLNTAFIHIVGLRYGVAVATLCSFHVLGMVYLYRTLNLLGRSEANALLVALYACYVHTWVQLGWWIAGLERVPFVAFGMMALFHYVRYQTTRARRDLVLVWVCDLVALGFYSKALLLPLCMLGLDVARFPVAELRARFRSFVAPWLTAIGLLVSGALCSVLEHHAAGTLASALGKSPASKVEGFTMLGLLSYAHSLFGVSMNADSHVPRLLIAVLWLAVLGYTTYRTRRALVAWAVLFILVLVNIVMIGVSNRVAVFGIAMAFETRYYWELCFFSWLLVGVIVHALPRDAPEAAWLRIHSRAAGALGAVLLCVYGLVSYRSFSSTALAATDAMPKTRAFMDTLAADLRRLNSRQAPLKFEDGNMPGYVVGLDFTFQRHSQLLFLMGERVAYALPGKADYHIGEDGHLVRIQRTRRH
ncbi:MAG TPA: hypothetical protein VH062_31830 [Polyangiaceae bacterium]|nr:hypothetical protein [Polyangiaceae bacterium]